MTQPTTPSSAIAASAARLKAAQDATRELARRLDAERRATPEEAAGAATIPQP